MQIQIKNKGFTLLEVMVALSILVLISVFLVSPLMSFYRRIVFNNTVENILSTLEEARKSTLSSYKSSQYGVHFESNRMVFYKGNMFVEPNPDNVETTLNNLVEIYSIIISGGGSDILFDRLTGETSNGAQLSVRLVNNPAVDRTITVYASGLVENN